ncbi:MAG: ribosome maturation factor RimP [Tissierellia bacterium]|nr:ribosome maturation factor RimP [Tissierellia bacterium]
MKKSVVEMVTEIVQPFLEKHNFELYDIEFIKEDGERYLRVYIDKEPTVGFEDIELVSKFLSDELDRTDPIKESYYLEVSSPGAERLLKKDADFKKYQGHKVEVQLIRPLDGLNRYIGRLVSKDETNLVLELRPKKTITIPVELIDYVKNILEI